VRHTWTSWDYHAICEDCGWEVHAKNGLGIAAQHHDRTGHTVVIDVYGSVRYCSDAENKKMIETHEH